MNADTAVQFMDPLVAAAFREMVLQFFVSGLFIIMSIWFFCWAASLFAGSPIRQQISGSRQLAVAFAVLLFLAADMCLAAQYRLLFYH